MVTIVTLVTLDVDDVLRTWQDSGPLWILKGRTGYSPLAILTKDVVLWQLHGPPRETDDELQIAKYESSTEPLNEMQLNDSKVILPASLHREVVLRVNEHRHCRTRWLGHVYSSAEMARAKTKRTREELLDHQAQLAWEYRQRHKEVINAKARIRMQKRREELQKAPSEVQLQQSVKAAQYRRNYTDRTKQTKKATSSKTKSKSTPSKSKKKDGKSTGGDIASGATNLGKAASSGQPKNPLPKPPLPPVPSPRVGAGEKSFNPVPRPRAPDSPSPMSLAAIAREESSEEDSGSEDEGGWEGDNERDAFGPVLQATRERGYLPEPGQQPFVRNGRTYWF
ncbi:hypothetical protein B0H10DRAFT_1943228 [Mycena sp. CBHHK59/15]|nr:hypothetical protein B0H10DRAFT_1943228 [Mycena sp. CBHHK59/15]